MVMVVQTAFLLIAVMGLLGMFSSEKEHVTVGVAAVSICSMAAVVATFYVS